MIMSQGPCHLFDSSSQLIILYLLLIDQICRSGRRYAIFRLQGEFIIFVRDPKQSSLQRRFAGVPGQTAHFLGAIPPVFWIVAERHDSTPPAGRKHGGERPFQAQPQG